MRPLIAANWKMNGTRAAGLALARGVLATTAGTAAEMALCPPFTLLGEIGAVLRAAGRDSAGPDGRAASLGAQDCHAEPAGAHTGSVSAPMLADLGCRFVIVGHSERRHGLGETDAAVKAKAAATGKAGLIPILCVGETAAERDSGRTLDVVGAQLAGSLPSGSGGIEIAYEPVWAIGTGRVPTADDIARVHGFLRQRLAALRPDGAAIRILYGGSVKPDNAAAILAVKDVGGLLVGGASLDAAGFAAIVRAAG
jgi:triosephosphate isomerase (TIM)